MNTIYPPKPINAASVNISPSASFQKEVVGVMFSIVMFIIVYLALVVSAVVLAIGCFYYGGMLIIAMPKMITILIGLGLMALGLSIVIFLVKFVFAKRTDESASRVEITEAEQPRLFAFIRQLTEETQTPFPKKIYLSSEVNACVFYNSSFWSMFFPVKKNLEIGLGLVNAINMGEFKAVMAHEFGHFSQRSMKLGSFTYNVNQVIYNMLYDNNSYLSFLTTWASIDGILAIFARITVAIAQSIQWILKQMYGLVNKRYLSLSREMEFHADAVAASVAGGNNLVTALNRIELAAACYQEAINKVNEALAGKRASGNIFDDQIVVMQNLAATKKLPLQNGLPVVSAAYAASNQQSRVNFKNQWASHPTNEEREEKLNALGLQVPVTEARAWDLFDQPAAWQQKITNHLYTVASVEMQDVQLYDQAAFKQQYEEQQAYWTLPGIFQEIYKGRLPEMTALQQVNTNEQVTWESIDTPENRTLGDQLQHNERDLKIVEAIANKSVGVKSFDFDGQKYTTSDASAIVTTLGREVTLMKERLLELDKRVLAYLLQQQPDQQVPFRQWSGIQEKAANACENIMETLRNFQQGTGLTVEIVLTDIRTMKAAHETRFKEVLKRLLEEGRFGDNTTLASEVEVFVSKNFAYFIDDQFINEELGNLQQIMHKSLEWIHKQKFLAFKNWAASVIPAEVRTTVDL